MIAKCKYRILTAICIAGIMAATLVPLTQAGSNIYVFDFKWGSAGSTDNQFQYPIAIAQDSSGNIYITDQNNNRVQEFGSDGHFIRQFGSAYLSYPQGIAVSPSNGYIYVASNGNAKIIKFDSNGNYIGQITGSFTRASGIAFDSNSNLYLVSWQDRAVFKFSSSDAFVKSWGSSFRDPQGIGIDHNNNIYVADSSNNVVKKFNTDGNLLATLGGYGTDDGQMNYPLYIGVDSSNNIYVSEQNSRRIQKFDSSGNFVTKWGSTGSNDGEFTCPEGVMVASNGKVYVADLSGRIQVFKEQTLVVTPEAPWGIAAIIASIGGIIAFATVQKSRKVTVYPK